MPIYEFACDRCRKIYQFFFRSAAGSRKPSCPDCQRKGMRRLMSGFAVKKRTAGEGGADAEPDLDPVRMERAMAKLERQMEGLDENNPREMGRFMRHMMKETGMELDAEMETAIRRLEAGEDPDRIEEDMGDVLSDGGPAGESSYGYDDTLYEG